MRLLSLTVFLSLLAGCAVVDPHNILGRMSAPASAVPDVSPNAWRAPALEYVWNTINDKYYDPKFNGVDWRAARQKYATQLAAASSDDEYWELLDKMAGELHDSHTRVHSAKAAEQQRKNESHSLGISFREVTRVDGNALILTSVHAESDAYWAGARAGMIVKTINAQPALPYFKQLISEVRDSSTQRARERGAVRKISFGDVGTSVSMEFVRPDGSEISTTMKRRVFNVAPRLVQRVLPSGYGYIGFSGFAGSLESGVLRAISSMKNTPGMILDLRNNGGGSMSMTGKILSQFLNENTKGPKILTRTGKPPTLFFVETTKLEPELLGNKNAYTKPLVVLTNEGSASAAEAFSITMQELGRATIVGERTCGCLLGFLGYAELPGGGRLAYSEMGFVSTKGRRIEGEGVIPDRGVSLSQDDYLLNRDPALEVAEAILRERSTPQK